MAGDGEQDACKTGTADPDAKTREARARTPRRKIGDHPPLLSAGDLIAGRYHVIEFIARGGMGEVYSARDEELREEVALKIISPELASDERSVERFKREILLARRVTHANVCRILEFGNHRGDAGGPRIDLVFFTMELVRGGTLAQLMRSQKQLALDEALPIVKQIAAAIDAAHEAGVVHRDLKPGNVMLSPGRPPDTDLEVKVTDFGIAHSGADPFAEPSEEDAIVGSPAYMSPEQITGGEVTGRADLYSFGIVIYEMVTGERPFVGDASMTSASKRLREPPIPPRVKVSTLDRRWDGAILRCLHLDPAKRFATAQELVDALTLERPRRSRAPWWVAAGAVALAAIVAFGLHAQHEKAAAGSARRAIAVLPPQNLAGRADSMWLSTALAETMRSELAAGGKLRVSSSSDVARAKIETHLPDASNYDRRALEQLRRNLGADLVVAGSYLLLGDRLRIDVSLEDAASGETLVSFSENGASNDLFELVTRTGARLREKLGAGEVTALDAVAVRAALPRHPEAQRLYAQGLAKLHAFNAVEARELFTEAAATEPDQPLIHAALASACSALGYDAQARNEAQRAFDLASGLPRTDRMWVEGQLREANHEWPLAVEIYRSLWKTFPDHLDYGLRLAAVYTAAGEGKAATAVLADMRRLPSPLGDDPRVDLATSKAAHLLGDHAQHLAFAEKAVKGALGRKAPLLAAYAQLEQRYAFDDIGKHTEALAVDAQVMPVLEAAGDREGIAETKRNMGATYNAMGQIENAMKYGEESLALFRAIGNRSGAAGVLNNIALVQLGRAELVPARKTMGLALTENRQIGDQSTTALVLVNLGNIDMQLGDLDQALADFTEARTITNTTGDRSMNALAAINIAQVDLLRGDLAEVRPLLDGAMVTVRAIDEQSKIAAVHTMLGDLALIGAHFDEARKEYAEAVRICKANHEDSWAAETALNLSEIELDEGNPSAAVTDARAAMERAHAASETNDELWAALLLARAQLAAGAAEDALRTAATAVEIARRSSLADLTLYLGIVHARAQAATGTRAVARKALVEIRERAAKQHFARIELEARLALAELEGKPAALLQLAQAAHAKGFDLVVRDATAAAHERRK